MTLHDLPYGTVIKHAGKLYFKSKGLDHDILTGTDGMWHFLHEGMCSKWKTWTVAYTPSWREYWRIKGLSRTK